MLLALFPNEPLDHLLFGHINANVGLIRRDELIRTRSQRSTLHATSPFSWSVSCSYIRSFLRPHIHATFTSLLKSSCVDPVPALPRCLNLFAGRLFGHFHDAHVSSVFRIGELCGWLAGRGVTRYARMRAFKSVNARGSKWVRRAGAFFKRDNSTDLDRWHDRTAFHQPPI